MKSTTPKRKREAAPGPGPLSVPLPPELRARIAHEAKKRSMKMATVARILLDERVTELEDAEQLSRVEEWQRAQAWATWDKVNEGDRRDVPMERFDEHTAEALAQLDRPAKAS